MVLKMGIFVVCVAVCLNISDGASVEKWRKILPVLAVRPTQSSGQTLQQVTGAKVVTTLPRLITSPKKPVISKKTVHQWSAGIKDSFTKRIKNLLEKLKSAGKAIGAAGLTVGTSIAAGAGTHYFINKLTQRVPEEVASYTDDKLVEVLAQAVHEFKEEEKVSEGRQTMVTAIAASVGVVVFLILCFVIRRMRSRTNKKCRAHVQYTHA